MKAWESLLLALFAGIATPCRSAEPAKKPARLDVPFTLEVKTPHVPWGKPLAGAPIRAFVVPSVSEGRTLVELAERLDLAYDTVMIDDAWDVNTWTVGTDENYEARNYQLVYKYLEEDLAKPTPYDVIVLPSLHGWNRLPQAAREAIKRRVAEGTGLVLIHPTTGLPAPDDPRVEGPLNDFSPRREVPPGEDLWELSPLVGALSDRLDAHGYREIRLDAVTAGRWEKTTDHFITANLPLELFPADQLRHYKYQLGKDSAALILGADEEPIVAVKEYGKGRVVALGFVNSGLSPMIDWQFLGRRDDRWWEYFYSLMCRSIVWAAKREPRLALRTMSLSDPPRKLSIEIQNSGPGTTADLTAAVRRLTEGGENEGGAARRVELRRGSNKLSLDLPARWSAGPHAVDVVLSSRQQTGRHYDWGTVSFELPKPAEIISLSLDREFYGRGDKAKVSIATRGAGPQSLIVELFDNRGRLLASQLLKDFDTNGPSAVAELEVGTYTTQIGWVRATLLAAANSRQAAQGEGSRIAGSAARVIDRRQARVNFAALDRGFGAYELIMPWYGPPSYQPWTPALDDQLRKAGVSVVETPERNFRLIRQIQTPGFGVYWHYREAYLKQKDNYLDSGNKSYLVREPDLSSDEWLEKLRGIIRKEMTRDKGFRPLAYYLADESSLTAYGDPLDLSWSAPTLAKFRQWLTAQYASLAALNEEWESHFASWDDVMPLTTAEAQAKGNFAGWMDHRTFMERAFADAVRVAAETVKQEDPGSRPSISGTQEPGPSNAVNWYLLDQIVDYLQPYSEDDQDELHRTMRPGQVLTGFTGYQTHGKELRHELWHRLFHGQIGASVFWQYTALNADLTLTEQGRDLGETVNELRNEGLALLLRGAERENCGIAVHYSLLSVRGEWITDGHIHPHEVSNGDATSPHLKRFHSNRRAWLQAFEDAGYEYDFLTTEQIEAGKLAGYRVLVLPDSIALSDVEVAAIHKFVESGGLLLTDAETGLMDGHGRWQTAGRLDDVLGVQRIETRSAPEGAAMVRLEPTLSGGRVSLEVAPVGLSLRTTTGRPGASADVPSSDGAAGQALFLIDNRFGAGRSVSLNFWMTDYQRLRKAGAQSQRLELLRDYLTLAEVRPVADARRASGELLRCSELVAYRSSGARFLAVLPEPDCADAGVVTLDLHAPQYVYDLRAHRLLGRLARLSGWLAAGEPLFYAVLPEPLGRLTISAAASSKGPSRAKPGETLRFFIHLAAKTALPAPRRQPTRRPEPLGGRPKAPPAPSGERWASCPVHVEVRDPSGKLVDYYTANFTLANGEGEFSIPLARNDRPGLWHVTAREPFAHQTGYATFQLTR